MQASPGAQNRLVSDAGRVGKRRKIVKAARRWEHFEHQADIGVRGIGPTPAAAFEEAAIALNAVIAEPQRIRPRIRVAIRCENENQELLFADWLNALLLEMGARRMLFRRFAVRLAAPRLTAYAWGEPLDPPRHRPAVEVKAASYAGLRVARQADGRWYAQCIVDV
jgi:SHS2 domain-containing protein